MSLSLIRAISSRRNLFERLQCTESWASFYSPPIDSLLLSIPNPLATSQSSTSSKEMSIPKMYVCPPSSNFGLASSHEFIDTGSQISTPYSRRDSSEFHSMGSCFDTGCSDETKSLCTHLAPCFRSHDCQSYWYHFGMFDYHSS